MTAELARTTSRAAEAAVMRGDALESLHGVKKLEVLLPMPMITALSASPPCAAEASSRPLRELLTAADGPNWSLAIQEALLAAAGFSSKTLENCLRDGFFDQDCKLFHQRPFILHIRDGRCDRFSALVNYHQLDRRQLEKLT